MLKLYTLLTTLAAGPLSMLLKRRLARGKEEASRIDERKGVTTKARPDGPILWIHAASVGESQSALILIDTLLKYNPQLNILVTTGTLTSAHLMNKNLPARAFHQFYPLDHPKWVKRFLDYWRPDGVFWMESELWPNMLIDIKRRNIPAALINARLSDTSFKNWSLIKRNARDLLSTFNIILAQTKENELNFKSLGAKSTVTTDNLKYSAAPLPVNDNDLKILSKHLKNRTLWLYASTHKGEEERAARIHKSLCAQFPDLLTIIVPRHPDRRADIVQSLSALDVKTMLRGEHKAMPDEDIDVYIADTLGELGLFYRLCPIACIGRSFSDDGGGGHNPIEAAQLGCAVLHGPNIQYQQEIYDEMNAAGAALCVNCEDELTNTLQALLCTPEKLEKQQEIGLKFANNKNQVIDRVMIALGSTLAKAGLSS